MSGERSYHQKKERNYVNYRCYNRNNSMTCRNPKIGRDSIEAYTLEQLSHHIFDDKLIPVVAAECKELEKQLHVEENALNKKNKQRLCTVNQQIDNIAEVIAETASLALIDKLTSLEQEKAKLTYEIDQLEQNHVALSCSVSEIRTLFQKARRLFREKKLSSMQKLIDMFIDKVVIYPDSIDLHIKLNPDISSFDTALDGTSNELIPGFANETRQSLESNTPLNLARRTETELRKELQKSIPAFRSVI